MRSISWSLSLTLVAACAGGDKADDTAADTAPLVTPEDDVVEIALRRLNEGQDLAAFEAARDAFVAQLKAQPGVGVDREFQAVIDFSTFSEPSPAVFTGMTQYDDLAAFEAAGAALGGSAEAGAFFSTFTPELFTVLSPLETGAAVDLAAIAPGSDDVLEVAVRDLSAYEGFDAAAYASARDAFLDLLVSQPGVVSEHQWVSVLDPNIVVGMTVYEDINTFYAVASDPAVAESAQLQAFLGAYPPKAGFVHAVVR